VPFATLRSAGASPSGALRPRSLGAPVARPPDRPKADTDAVSSHRADEDMATRHSLRKGCGLKLDEPDTANARTRARRPGRADGAGEWGVGKGGMDLHLWRVTEVFLFWKG
jgi:hypothetical protein